LKLQDLLLKIWFFIRKLKQSTLGCASTLSEASWLRILEHLSHSSEICRSHSHSSCCYQHGTSHTVEAGLKLLPSLNRRAVYDICGVYRTIYMMTIPWVSQACLFNCTYMQDATKWMAKFIYPITI